MKKAGLMVLAMMMVMTPLVLADAHKSGEVMATKDGICFQCPAEKLGRGMSNIVYSTLEVPYRIGREMEIANPVAGFTSGALKGVFWTVSRLLVGAVEVVTFLIPTKPMIHDFDAGWWTA